MIKVTPGGSDLDLLDKGKRCIWRYSDTFQTLGGSSLGRVSFWDFGWRKSRKNLQQKGPKKAFQKAQLVGSKIFKKCQFQPWEMVKTKIKWNAHFGEILFMGRGVLWIFRDNPKRCYFLGRCVWEFFGRCVYALLLKNSSRCHIFLRGLFLWQVGSSYCIKPHKFYKNTLRSTS